MDDDALRHGKPATHIAYDEATAVLVGDALMTYAFEILSDVNAHPDPFVRCELVSRLAAAIGFHGHQLQFEDMVHALDEDREPLVDGREARKAVEIILAIYRSAREGRMVDLPLEATENGL